METTRVSAWVDITVIDHLHKLRREQPHIPTLRMMATRVVLEGLESLGNDGREGPFRIGATPGGQRQSLTFRLPTSLHSRVLQVCEDVSEAGTPSAALHLLLWLGLNRLQQKDGDAAAA